MSYKNYVAALVAMLTLSVSISAADAVFGATTLAIREGEKADQYAEQALGQFYVKANNALAALEAQRQAAVKAAVDAETNARLFDRMATGASKKYNAAKEALRAVVGASAPAA